MGLDVIRFFGPDYVRERTDNVLSLPSGRDFRAPDNRKDWPTHDNVRVKPLGPATIEVVEHRIPAFLLRAGA